MQQNIISLKDSIKYQKDSVVSREILKKEGGTVTIFAFDVGQGLSEHASPYNAVIIIIDGTAEIIVSKERNELKAGEMLLMPANAPHSLRAIQSFKMILIMIKS